MDEIGTEAKIGRDLWAEVKMCTPVHGLSGFSAIEQSKSPCTGVHIFTFAPKPPSNLASVPISSDFSLNIKAIRADCLGKGFRIRGLTFSRVWGVR